MKMKMTSLAEFGAGNEKRRPTSLVERTILAALINILQKLKEQIAHFPGTGAKLAIGGSGNLEKSLSAFEQPLLRSDQWSNEVVEQLS
jgi:hypothetical protein